MLDFWSHIFFFFSSVFPARNSLFSNSSFLVSHRGISKHIYSSMIYVRLFVYVLLVFWVDTFIKGLRRFFQAEMPTLCRWCNLYLAECRRHYRCRHWEVNADGIENVTFWGFWAQNHQILVKKMLNLYAYIKITFSMIFKRHFWMKETTDSVDFIKKLKKSLIYW